MFVIITPNSLNTKWIYFEAGFAYAKGVEVVPVCIGISITKIGHPLSIFQGFEISNRNHLTYFITVINKKYGYKFTPEFTVDHFISLSNI